MRRGRLEANHWLLLGAAVVLALVGGDYLRTTSFKRPLPEPPDPTKEYRPDFVEGGKAPDFTLPDRSGKPHRLSDLVQSETVLVFVSDDARCRALLQYIRTLIDRRRKGRQPTQQMVCVADFPPERETAFRVDSRLEGAVLYEKQAGAVHRQFRAVPTPRVFELAKGLEVITLHASPAIAPFYEIGHGVRQSFQYHSPTASKLDRDAPDPVALKAFDAPPNNAK
jgi:hypothetical protein